MFPIENIVSHYKEEASYTFQFQSKLEKLDTITLHTTQVIFLCTGNVSDIPDKSWYLREILRVLLQPFLSAPEFL